MTPAAGSTASSLVSRTTRQPSASRSAVRTASSTAFRAWEWSSTSMTIRSFSSTKSGKYRRCGGNSQSGCWTR